MALILFSGMEDLRLGELASALNRNSDLPFVIPTAPRISY
jgi:hypothetical protein